jgi:CheY-like chemotaxis protein
MTAIVAAPEGEADRVVDALSDREVDTATTLADARTLLDEAEPTVVLVASKLPDGDGADLLETVQTGEHAEFEIPVLELLEPLEPLEPDAEKGTDDGTDGNAVGGDSAGDGSTGTTGTSGEAAEGEAIGTAPDGTSAFDDRVPSGEPDAIASAVDLAVAVSEYREATAALYDCSSRRSTEESTDPGAIDEARETAGERLLTVQRLAGGRTPVGRLLRE